MLVPLLFEDSVQGVVHVISYEAGVYQEYLLRFLESLAIFTANAIVNAQLYKQAQDELAERRRAEAALARERTMLRTLIEHIPDGIYAMDTQGRKILANRADLVHMGASFEFEVLGKTDLEWFGEAGKQYYEDDMYVIHSGVPIVNKEEHSVTKKGEQRWALTTKLPLRDAQGQIIGLVGISRDITEQKLATQALKESERLFRQLLDLIPHYISIRDSEGKFIIANLAFAQSVEMTPEELIGRFLLDVAMDSAEARQILESDQQVITSGIIQSFPDQTYTDRFGIIHWLEITKVPIEVRGKTAVLEIGIDVTNYKLTEAALRESEMRYRLLNEELEKRVQERTAQLQAANQELESFSYSVSHDLRAPLRTLDGFSLALLEDYSERLDEQGKYYLQRIRTASQRMAALIDDLLMLSRVTRAEMQLSTINLSQIARSIIEEWQIEQPSRQVTFIAPPQILVRADLNLMRIMLTNLLGNAWKFTSKHPTATIELGEMQQDGQRVIFLRDDGAGFDMAYADRLFKAFQRLHKDTEFEGTGIGLATVQRIIFRHGGKIWVYSEVERGTTFYFVLPD
jgi:PAS domain S-box-containing protein